MTDKRKRLEEVIMPLLKCLVCKRTNLELVDNTIHCRNCRATYPVHEDIPIMTTVPHQAFEFSPAVVVENSYPQQWLDLIESAGDELVLDLGSGNNPNNINNLVKLEIFALPNVDVVGFGENMPFKDETFNTIFSGAVLEHVSDPPAVVSNMQRILRDGGQVYIETAFLQPVHAYPNHFFNMTKQGLEELCRDFNKLSSGVKPHQYPSFTLQWILNKWQENLEGEKKEAFLQATVQDILDEYAENVFSNRWMSGFTEVEREELACGVYYHGQRRVRKRPSLWQTLKSRLKNSAKGLLGRI